jgi:VWFA-related protein
MAKLHTLNSLLLCCLLTQQVVAQQPSPPTQTPRPGPSPAVNEPKTVDDQDVVKITTNLVQIDAVVTDKSGKRIVDLKPEEVEIYEDGQARAITNFSYINLNSSSPPPPPAPVEQKANVIGAPVVPRRLRPEQVRRTIALVVDDLGLSFESAFHVRQSLKKFLDEQLQPDDLVAIIRTSGGIGALQSFTTDRRQLYAAVDKVKWNLIGRSEISANPFISTAGMMTREDAASHGGVRKAEMEVEKVVSKLRQDMFAVGTLGALHYVVKGLESLPGRKSVILFSDGITLPRDYADERILGILRELTEFANRASVVLYTVDARGLQTLGLSAGDSTAGLVYDQVVERLENRKTSLRDTQDGLTFLSAETGGIAILNSNDLNLGIKRILDDQQGYYLIGYKPDEATFAVVDGQPKLHHLRVNIKRPGEYRVRTRSGFYGRTDEARVENLTSSQQLGNALSSPFGASDIQLKLTSIFANSKPAGSLLQSFLHVKASDLTFSTEADGSRKATFEIAAVTFGDNGKIIDQFIYPRSINVAAADYERVDKNGFVYRLTIPIKKAGAYQLRMAVRDETSKRIGAASQFVEVPDLSKNRLTVSGILLSGIPLETYSKSASVQQAGEKTDGANLQADPNSNPAVRLFKTDHALVYAFNIYNARVEKSTGKPKLKTQLRIYRDGKLIFVGEEEAFTPLDQSDAKRLLGAGVVRLGSQMVPGEYVLQLAVTDLLGKQKENVTSQWIDFDVIK